MKGKNVIVSSLLILALMLLLITGFLTYYTIDEGERGVVLRNGRFLEVSEPGLHFKTPFIDSVHFISIRSQNEKLKGEAYTKDQQTTKFKLSINFLIPSDKIKEVYTKYQTIDDLKERLLQRIAISQIKNAFGQFTAHLAIQDRSVLIQKIESMIKDAVKKEPIEITSIQLEDIAFSKAYEKSIEDRMMAEVAVTTQRQNLEKERVNAEIKITKAKGEAEAKLAQSEAEAKAIAIKAKSEAEAIQLKGEAEANAIKAKSEIMKENAQLGAPLVSLIAAEKWNGQLPQTMLPTNSLPMINLEKK